MADGFAYLRDQPVVRVIVTLAPALNLFGNALFVLLPTIAVRIWLVTDQQFGLFESAFPLGFAIGAAALMTMTKRIRYRGWWMLSSIFLTGVMATGIALSPNVLVALPFGGDG